MSKTGKGWASCGGHVGSQHKGSLLPSPPSARHPRLLGSPSSLPGFFVLLTTLKEAWLCLHPRPEPHQAISHFCVPGSDAKGCAQKPELTGSQWGLTCLEGVRPGPMSVRGQPRRLLNGSPRNWPRSFSASHQHRHL